MRQLPWWAVAGGLILVAGIVAVSVALVAGLGQRGKTGSERPNIILVVADDLDLALYERLDGLTDLAADGIDYPNAYVTTPLCCPSRVSILTGQYAHTHGVRSNNSPGGGYSVARDLGVESQTVAVWLQQAGYRTAFIGKYMNGYNLLEDQRTPPGWDVWNARIKGGSYQDVVIMSGGKGQKRTLRGYETDRYADVAERFIRQTQDQPYFLYIAPYAPHDPWIPPERYADEPDPRYGSMLAVVDMINRLRATDPDAVLIFTSDNGFHFVPEPPGKGLPIEEDLHVPLFMLGLGRDVDQRYALNIDLAPTLADIAGITPPSPVDGLSLVDRSWERDSFDVEMANPAGEWVWRGTWGASPSIEWFMSPPALPDDPD
ncbi:MAG TPA: sulfatase-like hydrolase/transferase [Candidatus Limnocylindria bacterium]|nr:sulfatase-like hydrolase/transferase [Candidatus Limnocylindria bacterium]